MCTFLWFPKTKQNKRKKDKPDLPDTARIVHLLPYNCSKHTIISKQTAKPLQILLYQKEQPFALARQSEKERVKVQSEYSTVKAQHAWGEEAGPDSYNHWREGKDPQQTGSLWPQRMMGRHPGAGLKHFKGTRRKWEAWAPEIIAARGLKITRKDRTSAVFSSFRLGSMYTEVHLLVRKRWARKEALLKMLKVWKCCGKLEVIRIASNWTNRAAYDVFAPWKIFVQHKILKLEENELLPLEGGSLLIFGWWLSPTTRKCHLPWLLLMMLDLSLGWVPCYHKEYHASLLLLLSTLTGGWLWVSKSTRAKNTVIAGW